MAIYSYVRTLTLAYINQLAISYWFVASILYVCWCHVAVSVANGNLFIIPAHNEHTACTRMLKVSNIPEFAVEFERY